MMARGCCCCCCLLGIRLQHTGAVRADGSRQATAAAALPDVAGCVAAGRGRPERLPAQRQYFFETIPRAGPSLAAEG